MRQIDKLKKSKSWFNKNEILSKSTIWKIAFW